MCNEGHVDRKDRRDRDMQIAQTRAGAGVDHCDQYRIAVAQVVVKRQGRAVFQIKLFQHCIQVGADLLGPSGRGLGHARQLRGRELATVEEQLRDTRYVFHRLNLLACHGIYSRRRDAVKYR